MLLSSTDHEQSFTRDHLRMRHFLSSLMLAAVHNDDLTTAIKLLSALNTPPVNESAAATLSMPLNTMIRDAFRNLNLGNAQAFEFIQRLFRYLSTLDCFIEKSAVDEMQAFFARYEKRPLDP